MAYINSNNIEIFPTVFRGYSNKDVSTRGKFTTEENFVNIINSIVEYPKGQDGYIIRYERNTLELIIHGYYFKIKDVEQLDRSGNKFFSIRVERGSEKAAANALVSFMGRDINLDAGDSFLGLSISDTAPDKKEDEKNGVDTYFVQVFKGGNICKENMIRLSSKSVSYTKNDVEITLENKINNLETDINNLNTGKQNKLVEGSYISISNRDEIGVNEDGTKILNNLNSGLKNIPVNKLIGFGADSGQVIDSKGTNIGHKYKTGQAKNSITSQNVFISDGNITQGFTIYASTNSPDDSIGLNGDIWFQYQE